MKGSLEPTGDPSESPTDYPTESPTIGEPSASPSSAPTELCDIAPDDPDAVEFDCFGNVYTTTPADAVRRALQAEQVERNLQVTPSSTPSSSPTEVPVFECTVTITMFYGPGLNSCSKQYIRQQDIPINGDPDTCTVDIQTNSDHLLIVDPECDLV